MNTHVHPLMAGALNVVMPAPQPLHIERIEWFAVGSSRNVPPGRVLIRTRRDVLEGELDGLGSWRDETGRIVRDVQAWAAMPIGPLLRAEVAA